jgi:hypothetical protein
MLKKFTEGCVFGCGFAFSTIALYCLVIYMFFGSFIQSTRYITPKNLPSTQSNHSQAEIYQPDSVEKNEKPFHDLNAEEQIQKASVIALAKYEKADDGKMKAIITEFLKKNPNTEIYYNVGDEYTSSSYYPSDKHGHGDGVVIFFVGSPAEMRMSMSYRGDRITGLSDIPIKLFREKCAPVASS